MSSNHITRSIDVIIDNGNNNRPDTTPTTPTTPTTLTHPTTPTDPTHTSKISKISKISKYVIEKKRTVLDMSTMFPADSLKYVVGTIIYVVIFVLYIPSLIMRAGRRELLFAYVPNVDMIATILGYNGGPTIFNMDGMWRYLYNPSNFTLLGFLSTNLMNYFALLGATFIVAYHTHKTHSWQIGWSSAFLFLILTYLAPGNLIVIIQDKIGTYLNQRFGVDTNSNLQYSIVVTAGFLMAVGIILFEARMIRLAQPHLIRLIKWSGLNIDLL